LHILAFENCPTYHAGGQERSLHEVLKGLSGKGTGVSLFYEQEGELLGSYSDFCHTIAQVSTRAIYGHSLIQVTYDVIKSVILLKNIKPDLLYVNQYSDTPFPAILSLITGTPLICHLRLPSPHYLSRQYRWGLNVCHRLIAISEQTKQTYVEKNINPDKIKVVYNSVDEAVFDAKKKKRDGKANSSYRIGYFGRLCPPKGVEHLIKGFQIASKKRDDIVLYLYGKVDCATVDDSYLYELKKMSGKQLDDKIFFHGHVADPEFQIIKNDLIALPSTWQEPFGRIILEAMLLETPVIASRVGGIPEILSPRFDNFLFKSGNPEAIAKKILEHIDWRQKSPSLGEDMRKYAQNNFSREQQINSLQKVFEEVVSQ